MLRVIFTLDYEIHGSGMGSPGSLMVEPTQRMLDQFDRFGARLTVLADAAEILKFRQHAEATGRDDFCYGNIAAQLRRAQTTGHDVQLHLHSSYFNADYTGELWRMDYSEYDLAGLDQARVSEMIAQGKGLLEEILRPVQPDYRCFAFRAANWSMEPSRNIVRALLENGLTIDTSVFKYGRYDDLVHFDYSHAESELVPWPASEDDVCRRDPSGKLFEFPIYCERQPIWTFLTPNRVYRVLAERLNPLPQEAETETAPPLEQAPAPQSPLARLGKSLGMLARRHPWKADFNQCSGSQLISCLERAHRRYGHLPGDLPFVLIGHSKTFSRFNERILEPFLRHVRDRPERYAFGTFGDFDLESFR